MSKAKFLHAAGEALQRVRQHLPYASAQGIGLEILGRVQGPQKFAAYANADIFLFPSLYHWESFGLVLVEAACFGLPCVTYQPLVGESGLSPKLHRRVEYANEAEFIKAVEGIPLDHAEEIRADALGKFNTTLFGRRIRSIFREFPH
jgi:glycosyltransferase involved in cell wall biosynthesis